MYYFPFGDWLEKFIKWARSQGGWFYWSWVAITGLLGAIFILAWSEGGFKAAQPAFYVFLVFWLGGGLFIGWLEARRKNDSEQE